MSMESIGTDYAGVYKLLIALVSLYQALQLLFCFHCLDFIAV